MRFFFFLLFVLVLVACEETRQTKPERTVERAVEYNNGLNVTTRFHFDNHLGTKSVSGLSAPNVTWRFLSHRTGLQKIDVTGVCKVDWRNDTEESINGFYHIAFQDENGFFLAYVFDRSLTIPANSQESTSYRFTVNFDDLGVANLAQTARVVFTTNKLKGK